MCLVSNSVLGHLLASVTYKRQRSEAQAYGTCCFSYTWVVYIFFLSLLPLSPFSVPHTSSPSGFLSVALLVHPAISFLTVSSSALFFLFPLSPLLAAPFTSHTTTRLLSLPEYLQFKSHQSCFPPCCLWSSFSLHTDDGASNRKIS